MACTSKCEWALNQGDILKDFVNANRHTILVSRRILRARLEDLTLPELDRLREELEICL